MNGLMKRVVMLCTVMSACQHMHAAADSSDQSLMNAITIIAASTPHWQFKDVKIKDIKLKGQGTYPCILLVAAVVLCSQEKAAEYILKRVMQSPVPEMDDAWKKDVSSEIERQFNIKFRKGARTLFPLVLRIDVVKTLPAERPQFAIRSSCGKSLDSYRPDPWKESDTFAAKCGYFVYSDSLGIVPFVSTSTAPRLIEVLFEERVKQVNGVGIKIDFESIATYRK